MGGWGGGGGGMGTKGFAASHTKRSVAARAGMLPHLRHTRLRSEPSPMLLITIVAAAAANPVAAAYAALPPKA